MQVQKGSEANLQSSVFSPTKVSNLHLLTPAPLRESVHESNKTAPEAERSGPQASDTPPSAGLGNASEVDSCDQAIAAARCAVLEYLQRFKKEEPDERRRLYKALLLKWHPDKNPGNTVQAGLQYKLA
jgi:hypothetical protein